MSKRTVKPPTAIVGDTIRWNKSALHRKASATEKITEETKESALVWLRAGLVELVGPADVKGLDESNYCEG